jgi:hypothetical protein
MSLYTFPLDNHLVVFRPADKRLFILNPTAAWIWKAVAEGFKTSEIIKLLAEHFHISTEDAERDVHAVLDQWSEYSLEPSQPNKETKHLATPTSSMRGMSPGNKMLPANAQINFQGNYYYGQSSFTLTDYTPDLEPYFSPLLTTLKTADKENPKNKIAIFKDSNEYVVLSENIELERTSNQLVAIGRVIQEMVESGYPDTTWMAFIHGSAGALDDHGVVFPGIGGSGKSTLMAALSQTGWEYWCDDMVPVDIQKRVAPVPLSHCIKSGSWDVLAPYYKGFEKLPVFIRSDKEVRYLVPSPAQPHFSETKPVHSLVFPLYTPGKPQRLLPISPVEGLQRLVEAQSWISPDPAHAEEMINWISTVPIYTLVYNSLDWAIKQLNQLVRHT